MAKKLFFTLSIIAFFASCGTRNNNANTFDEGVVISGIRWATRNVDAPGTFAESPESAGGFFTFEDAKNACPRGWRLPTYEELRALNNAGSEWTIQNDVNGRIFGIAPNQIFLPASGWRCGFDDSFSDVNTDGCYWGSTQHDIVNFIHLWFGNGFVDVLGSLYRHGLSVRCVAK